MNRINRLKYTGVIAGVGLAVVVLSNGAYANTGVKETAGEPETGIESEIEVYSLDLSENTSTYDADDHGIQPLSLDEEGQSEPESDVVLSAGAGDVLTDGENGTEPSGTGDPAEPDTADDSTEPDTADDQDEIGLSAGAGAVFEQADEEDSAVQARNIEIPEEVSEPETHWGYTNLGIAHVDNHLNIREEPNESGKLIGKLSKDAACEILGIDENGWAHIKSGKVEGYCSTEFLYLGDAAVARGHEVASMIAIVNTQTLKVRGEPNTDSIVITLIPQEEELEVVEVMENGWIKFLLDDEEAYVSGDYVDVEERLEKAVTLTELKYGQGVSDVRVDLVQYAKQFVGNPYVWGGTSLTNGADCSGFTLSIYKKYGVSLPHHAASQAQMGTKIDYGSAQPGDLVFYAKNGSINHVAIYIGNGQVIHASSPKTGIKISSWNYRTPECIRRYLAN
ncbi:MAG: C40 family peptidase [Lachnospiraceae bacterium]|nr:C40 family peptidase [Lachnospiraceae bacterium]